MGNVFNAILDISLRMDSAFMIPKTSKFLLIQVAKLGIGESKFVFNVLIDGDLIVKENVHP